MKNIKNIIPVFLIYFAFYCGASAILTAASIISKEHNYTLYKIFIFAYAALLAVFPILYVYSRRKIMNKFGVSFGGCNAAAFITAVVTVLLGTAFFLFSKQNIDIFIPPNGDPWHDDYRCTTIDTAFEEGLGGAGFLAFVIIVDIIIGKIISKKENKNNN